jgi:hypothetical protein
VKILVAVLLGACLIPGSSHAQAPASSPVLTPETVQQAIDWGTGKTKINGEKLPSDGYMVDTYIHWYTPFLRVALAAQEAQKTFRQFGPADVSAILADPLCHAVVLPWPLISPTNRYNNPERIVITPEKSEDLSKVIEATWTKPYINTLKNSMGLVLETRTLTAAFPCDALTPKTEFVLIRERDSISKRVVRFGVKEKELAKWR